MFAEESPPSRPPPPEISRLPTHLLLRLIGVKPLFFLLLVPLPPQYNPLSPSILSPSPHLPFLPLLPLILLPLVDPDKVAARGLEITAL